MKMKPVKQTFFTAVLILLLACGVASAQTAVQENTKSPTTRVDAANEYKSSSKQLLALQEDAITKATAKLEELRVLVSEGLVAKVELEDAEQKIAALRTQLQSTQKQISDADNMIAEIKAEQDLAKTASARPIKLVSKQYGPFSTTATILRYSGATSWSLGRLDSIQAFFTSRFGHSLPTSAVGQSATHNRLGYDHHNAVDVALHPDSSEGKALIGCNRREYPFLRFVAQSQASPPARTFTLVVRRTGLVRG